MHLGVWPWTSIDIFDPWEWPGGEDNGNVARSREEQKKRKVNKESLTQMEGDELGRKDENQKGMKASGYLDQTSPSLICSSLLWGGRFFNCVEINFRKTVLYGKDKNMQKSLCL